ncbi:MAG: hypothetical protein WCO96_03565 [Actinomycetes bacterium]
MLVLLGCVATSFAVIGPLLATGRHLTGGDGLYPVDQLQYLSWIRQAADHGLIANRWDMAPDTRVFLHPAWLISGGAAHWLGLPIEFSNFAIWKPVSILVAFIACRQYTRRMLKPVWPARVGLVLALFTLVPASTVLGFFGAGSNLRYNLDFITSEMWPGQQLIGYEVGAIAVFLVPLILLGLERSRGTARVGLLAVCSAGALLVTWLQPWQGAELVIIVCATELWRWWRNNERPWLPMLAVPVLGTLPAIYYFVLEQTDPAWQLYGKENSATANPIWDWSWWAVAICLLPLALPALLGLWRKASDWQGTAVRIWPIAVAFVYLQPSGTFPFHAVQGLSIPLAVLAVQGLTTNRPSRVPAPRWWWVVPALLILAIPGPIHRLRMAKTNVDTRLFPYEFGPGEREALDWLNSEPTPGAVLAEAYGGLLVPAFAGREAYMGTPSLTRDYKLRQGAMFILLYGNMKPTAAREFVRASGARFIFLSCQPGERPQRDLSPVLGPLVQRKLAFGCSRVYVLKPTPASRKLQTASGRTLEQLLKP